MKTTLPSQIDKVLCSEQGARLLDEARRLASTPSSKERIDALRRKLEAAKGSRPAPRA